MHQLLFKRFDFNEHISYFPKNKKILVAPLNWGLGHASRCIPIINQLSGSGYDVIIASDGTALEFLKKTFPSLQYFELPSYSITYSKFAFLTPLKIVFQFHRIKKTIKIEYRKINEIVENENIGIIISDNRFGVHTTKTFNIYLTHQLKILSGFSGLIASWWHQNSINRFDLCWIPDIEEEPNLSGALSHNVNLKIPIKYIGWLSQFEKKEIPLVCDLLILLSGPEPQRSIWEKQLLAKYKNSDLKIVMVRGFVEPQITKTISGNILIYNFLYGEKLEYLLNSSKKIIARSGYSTLMDLAVLDKKADLKATPYQPEQVYLEKHILKNKLFQ